MIVAAFLLSVTAQVVTPHADNAAYKSLLNGGVTIEGKTVAFPPPALPDGLAADAQRAALKGVAESDAKLDELLRDSVSAPFVLKLRDEEGGAGSLVRRADLWFVIRADLDALDPGAVARQAAGSKPVEAGNMRFASRRVDAGDLKSRGIAPGDREWFAHVTGRLLDRIHVEMTDRTVATRSDESWVVASRTDPRFDRDVLYPNRWWPIGPSGAAGPAQPYPGAASYAKFTRLRFAPGAVLVEAHFAFAEPRAWFDGAPILRSKIGLIAQDQIRRLRRELAEARKEESRRGSSRG